MHRLTMVKQISLDAWSIQHLMDLLKKGSRIVAKTNTPIVLYRQTMEEEDGTYEEIVCTLTDDYVIEQLIISGGMVVPAISQQLVYRLDEFPDRLLKKGSNIVEKTNTPIVLYRQTMEEKDDSHEEIICTLVKDNIIEQLVISGGMIVPTFKQQFVFTLEEFPDRLLRKSKDLFLETVELLEDKLK